MKFITLIQIAIAGLLALAALAYLQVATPVDSGNSELRMATVLAVAAAYVLGYLNGRRHQ